MLDLKIANAEEVQMTAQTENTVGIVELSDSDLDNIVGGAADACSCPPGCCVIIIIRRPRLAAG